MGSRLQQAWPSPKGKAVAVYLLLYSVSQRQGNTMHDRGLHNQNEHLCSSRGRKDRYAQGTGGLGCAAVRRVPRPRDLWLAGPMAISRNISICTPGWKLHNVAAAPRSFLLIREPGS